MSNCPSLRSAVGGLLPALLALVLSAGPAPARSWTLEATLDAARRQDPGIQSARSAAAAARSEASGDAWPFSPRVSLRGSALRSDDPALLFSEKLWQGRFAASDFQLDRLNRPGAATAWQWGVRVDQPLWNAGAELIGPGQAGHRHRASQAQEDAVVGARLLAAAGAYVEAVSAVAGLAADSLGWVAGGDHRRAAVERFRRGQVPELDTLRAAARDAEARSAWLEARHRLALALTRLGHWVGEPVLAGELSGLPENASAPPVATDAPGRGELRAAREQAAALELGSRRAGLSLLPSLNLWLAADAYAPDVNAAAERRWTAGAALELPLWDGGRRWLGWRAARASARAAREAAAALERDLALERRSAEDALELAAERLAAARGGAAAATEALRLASDRYRSGLLALAELLEADAQAARARRARVEAEAEVTLSRYRYLHALGGLR